jgi:Fe-S-cluster containining protein
VTVALEQFPAGCGGCGGACCQRQTNGVPPWNADEWERLDKILLPGLAALQRRAKLAGGVPIRCMMLLPDGRCGIHETKPQACLDEPVGGAEHCIPSRRAKGFPV